MKVTDKLIKWFELEQQTYNTGTALRNLLWKVASDMLTDIGVKEVATVYSKEAKDA